MTSLPDPPVSKGMKMIAAYRAARLSQRPVLRTTLRQTHAALRQGREQTLRSTDPAQSQPAQPAPQDEQQDQAECHPDAGSVFAGLITAATAEIVQITAHDAVTEPEPSETAPEADIQPGPVNDDPRETIEADQPSYDPPLAEIGFGPGMLIRLSQLGLHTMRDLAAADVSTLRAGLGDISRLVNVETWVNNARDHMKERHTNTAE